MTLIVTSIFVLLAGVVLCVFVPGNQRRAWISVTSQLIASIMIVTQALPILLGGPEFHSQFQWSFPVDRVGVGIDALSAFFLVFSLPMTLLGTIYAIGYLRPYFEKRARSTGIHFAILNMISLSFILIYTVENAMVFLLGWEIAAISAWLAVIWDYRNQKVRFAGFNYLISTHLSLLFLVAGFMIIGSATKSFDFNDFGHFLGTNSSMRNIAFLLLLTSFGLKSASQ